VFVRDDTNTGGDMQIWVMDADGSNQHAVTNLGGANRLPSWTADAKQIVFQHSESGNSEIYRVNVDGTGVTNLTNDAAIDWAPATSPTGKKIVFTSEREGSGHLYVLPPDGQLQRITTGPDYDYYANWSPRGNDIVFTRQNAAGQNDLYLVHSDGSGLQRLTNTPSLGKYFPAFSPDGKKIAYTECSGWPVPWHPKCATHVLDLGSGSVQDLAFPDLVLPNPYVDEFNDNVRDVNIWQLLHDGVGGYFAEANGRMEMTLDAAPGAFVSSRVDFHCLLHGDFDAQVDYTLLSWPAANGARVQIDVSLDDATVARESETSGESYNMWSAGGGSGYVPTSDTSGTLRVTRAGDTLTSYYWHDGAWVTIGSGPALGGTALISLDAATYNTFAGQPVRVAFDNFKIDAADRDCSSWRPDWHPDFQPLARSSP
jgi:dipeptidyl aminopeptidase/acylaminoacyl peptidase